ncbi:MAG: polysaccharide deacetylase family protein, partial [Desulfobacteraceae bacterium]
MSQPGLKNPSLWISIVLGLPGVRKIRSFKPPAIMALWGVLVFFPAFSGCAHHGFTALPVDEKIIALTFDDGPNALYTPKILEILKEHDVKATFFVIGRQAQAFPEILRNIKNAGHEIENHSWNHSFFLSAHSSRKIEKEICATQDLIFK